MNKEKGEYEQHPTTDTSNYATSYHYSVPIMLENMITAKESHFFIKQKIRVQIILPGQAAPRSGPSRACACLCLLVLCNNEHARQDWQ